MLRRGVTTPEWSKLDAVNLNANAVESTQILDGAVTNAKLAGSSVSTSKIADSQVTESKLAASAVATAKIADQAVTTAKMQRQSSVSYAQLQFASSAAPTFQEEGQWYSMNSNSNFQDWGYVRTQFLSRQDTDASSYGRTNYNIHYNSTNNLCAFGMLENIASSDTNKYMFGFCSNWYNTASSNYNQILISPTVLPTSGAPTGTEVTAYRQDAYTINGSWMLGSSKSYKKNIEPFVRGHKSARNRKMLDAMQLREFSFNYDSGKRRDLGFIFEELEAACDCGKKGDAWCACQLLDRGPLGTAPGVNMSAAALLQIEFLKEALATAEARADALEARVAALEKLAARLTDAKP